MFACLHVDSEFTKVRADRLWVVVTTEGKPLRNIPVELHEAIMDPKHPNFLRKRWETAAVTKGFTDAKGNASLGTVSPGRFFLLVSGEPLPIEVLVQSPASKTQQIIVNFYGDECRAVSAVERQHGPTE
jgi:hypothetical protein